MCLVGLIDICMIADASKTLNWFLYNVPINKFIPILRTSSVLLRYIKNPKYLGVIFVYS